jgi:ornithine carbamoyltransferase
MRHFLAVDALGRAEFDAVLDRADTLRGLWRANRMPASLRGHRLGLWFLGQGFRNRVAFELGARALGAEVVQIPGELGVHEPIEDIGAYLSNWFTLLAVRCARRADLSRLAADSSVPVLNGRTEFNHPCEIVGDLQYLRRERGSLDGLSVVFVGETTNLCMSWFEAARILPISVVQAGPPGRLPSAAALAELNAGAAGRIEATADLDSVLDPGVDLLYTDCWPKGGDRAAVRAEFGPYALGADRVARINPRGCFLPCPPVTRGEEVDAAALALPLCRNYAAKECLLHAQNALMEFFAIGL